MAQGNIYSIAGNLTADPELRFTQSGVAVASFTVANTARSYNKDTQEWEDGDTIFMRCNVWRQLAENVAESLTKGTRVMVSGWLKQREYDKDGVTHRVIELEVEEVGASLKMATAKITKTSGQNSGGYQQERQPSRSQGRSQSTNRSQGRASTRKPQNADQSYQSRYDDDEPPF